MPLFRKKPVVITAEQFNSVTNPNPFGVVSPNFHGVPHVTTPNGPVPIDEDDWVIDNTPNKAGDFYPCKPDVFATLYEPVA